MGRSFIPKAEERAVTKDVFTTKTTGSAKLNCKFTIVYTGTKANTKASNALNCRPKPKKTTRVTNSKITSRTTGNSYTITMNVAKTGRGTFSRITVKPKVQPGGSGKGSGLPGGSGKGSGPPGGSGKGSGPPGGSGKGSGGLFSSQFMDACVCIDETVLNGGGSGKGSGPPGG